MLNEKTLKSSLEAGSVLPVYLIAGDDVYLKKQALDRIIAAAVSPDDEMNLIRFDYGVELQLVYDELNDFPMIADKKCIVLSDFDVEKSAEKELEKLLELAKEPYDTSVFVLYFGNYELDFKKSSRVKKLVAAVKESGGDVVELNHKNSAELVRWLCAAAKRQGLLLSSQNAKYMLEICSTDINFLSNELIKLCAFTKEGEITKEIIERVCVKSVEASVYDLSRKIIWGDTAGAMKLLDELYYMNLEPMSMFYNISSSFVDMYRAYAAKSEGKKPAALTEAFALGNKGFLLERGEENLRKYDRKRLELSFDALIKCEKELKSYSVNNRAVLEKLVVCLIYIMKTGEALD